MELKRDSRLFKDLIQKVYNVYSRLYSNNHGRQHPYKKDKKDIEGQRSLLSKRYFGKNWRDRQSNSYRVFEMLS